MGKKNTKSLINPVTETNVELYTDTDSTHISPSQNNMDFVDPSVITENLQLVSNLEWHTKIILKLEENNKMNLFQIASQLEIIKENELYKEGGYTSITEYGERELNYKSSTTSALVRISQRFLDDEGNVRNEKLLSYSIYQLMEMLKLNETELQVALTDNIITPETSTKKIRESVKEIKGKKGDGKKNSENITVPISDETISEEEKTEEVKELDSTKAESNSTSEKKTVSSTRGELIEILTELLAAITRETGMTEENQKHYIELVKSALTLANK